MPASVKAEITLPQVVEPFVLSVHTIDAQSANVKITNNKLHASRTGVIIEDGYIIHIIIGGAAGFTLTMDVFVGTEKVNSTPIFPTFKKGNYEFLYIREA